MERFSHPLTIRGKLWSIIRLWFWCWPMTNFKSLSLSFHFVPHLSNMLRMATFPLALGTPQNFKPGLSTLAPPSKQNENPKLLTLISLIFEPEPFFYENIFLISIWIITLFYIYRCYVSFVLTHIIFGWVAIQNLSVIARHPNIRLPVC